MYAANYRGYTVRGFALPTGDGNFLASGGVDKSSRRLEESEGLGCFSSKDAAAETALAWAKA